MSIKFVQAIPGTTAPHPADKTAGDTLPDHACWSVREASGRGWHCYSPVRFTFEWDGDRTLDVWVNGEALGPLEPGGAVQHPDFASAWDASAPAHLRDELYPILSRSYTIPNMIQIWTGLLIDLPKGWFAEIRPVVNRPWPEGYYLYTGLFPSTGPLFASVILTHSRAVIPRHEPFFQLQMIPGDTLTQPMTHVPFSEWTEAEWRRYHQTVVLPSRARARAATTPAS